MVSRRGFALFLLLCFTTFQYGTSVRCGRPSVRPTIGMGMYIIGGAEARAHSWPWMVTIQTPYLGHICGGSILNKRWILTAAHCLDDFDAEWLSVGVGYHQQYVDDILQRDYQVEKTIMHANFTSRYKPQDIGLIKLSTDIVYSSHVKPVCLPASGHQWTGHEAFVVTGWGTLMENDPEENPHDVLLQVQVPLVTMEKCNGKDWYRGRIDPKLSLCAGFLEGGKDTCQLDSGGPLVTYKRGRWLQAGVVSWGIGCGRRQRPGIYVNVAEFIPWIEETISNNSR